MLGDTHPWLPVKLGLPAPTQLTFCCRWREPSPSRRSAAACAEAACRVGMSLRACRGSPSTTTRTLGTCSTGPLDTRFNQLNSLPLDGFVNVALLQVRRSGGQACHKTGVEHGSGMP